MRKFFARRVIIASIVFVVFGAGFFVFRAIQDNKAPLETPSIVNKSENPGPIHIVIGHSVEGRNIDAYTYPPRHQASGKRKTTLYLSEAYMADTNGIALFWRINL